MVKVVKATCDSSVFGKALPRDTSRLHGSPSRPFPTWPRASFPAPLPDFGPQRAGAVRAPDPSMLGHPQVCGHLPSAATLRASLCSSRNCRASAQASTSLLKAQASRQPHPVGTRVSRPLPCVCQAPKAPVLRTAADPELPCTGQSFGARDKEMKETDAGSR